MFFALTLSSLGSIAVFLPRFLERPFYLTLFLKSQNYLFVFLLYSVSFFRSKQRWIHISSTILRSQEYGWNEKGDDLHHIHINNNRSPWMDVRIFISILFYVFILPRRESNRDWCSLSKNSRHLLYLCRLLYDV